MELQSLRWQSALLEGIGVLVGILIAFGIDAAWDTRGDREREAVYLEALQAEIATNRARFEDHREFLRWTLQEDEKALRTVVFAEGPVTSDVILAMSETLPGSFLVLPERAALSDILSSGGISFVEDPGLRRLISRYADALDQQVAAQENLVGLWRGRMSAYFEAHGSLYDMAESRDWVTGGLGDFDFDVEAFEGNREFGNLVVHRSILAGLAVDATDELLGVIDELSAALDEAV